MAFLHRGKFFFIFLLFILSSPRDISALLSDTDSVLIQHECPHAQPESESTAARSSQQEALLYRLEELVRNLSEIVSRLESKLSNIPSIDESNDVESLRLLLQGSEKVVRQREFDDNRSEKEDGVIEGRGVDGDRGKKVVSVTKYSPLWSERFQFVSAVKLDSDATCSNVLPFRDYEGLSKYFAVGDSTGRVYVFLRNGDVLVDFYTTCDSPVTAMVSYLSVNKNESVVVTGHQNGVILRHRIYEGSNGEDLNSLVMEHVGKFESIGGGEDGMPITILEVHHVGRIRYVLSTDLSGKITVYRENGTVYGSAMPASRPLAFLKQRLLFLTESGAGSLDLRSMKVRESECEGFNHSLARSYVFDTTERSKAYGFTSEGDLIHVLLLGDIMNFKCRVRSKKKFDIEEPLTFQAIKGYLLIVNEEKVFVFNVSTQHYVRPGGPRLLFSASLEDIRSTFLNYQPMDTHGERRKLIPLIASDREKLIVIGLGSGYVGMYRSSLPVFKGEFNTMLWTSPVFFFVVFLFVAWHFFAKKKEALTSWGTDDPFTSTTPPPASAPATLLHSSSENRPFVGDSSSRSSDIVDLRSSTGLRGPPRRYPSPTRYPGGAPTSFRPAGSADPTSSRPTPVDSNFRPSSELKFRGSTLEPPGFPKRRESLYVNNQVVDDES